MWPFYIAVIALFAALHVLFYRACMVAFTPSSTWHRLLCGLLVLFFITPIIVHIMVRYTNVHPAQLIGLSGYVWISGVFWLCILFWFSMLWLLFLLARALARRPLLPARRAFYDIIGILVLLGIYGKREASTLHTEHVRFSCGRFPAHRPPLRIALISDLHLNVERNQGILAQAVARIKALQPDLILSGGDLTDSPHCLANAGQFATLQAPLGKYAVLGNHEYYLGLRDALPFHERSGFTLLRQTARELAPGLWLAGVDHRAGHTFGEPCFDDERAALAGVPRDACVILLKHEPRIAAHLQADVVLSGHTHGGQIFPFHLLVRRVYPCFAGRYQLDDRTQLYVSRGAGTFGLSFRLLAPAEITLVTLEPAPPR